MFDDIRPYNNSEIPAALKRIVGDVYFPIVCEFLFPGRPIKELEEIILSCQSADDFQQRIMYDAIYSIVHKTTDGLTVEGMDRLDPDKDYLFVSNHRDIMLDAALLQVRLLDAGRRSSEITFGANLMNGQMVIDVGKSNKMFRIERPSTVTSPREFLLKSKYVSEYIHYVISSKHESVWIAQRNGRTKDGVDATDQGIIKMFAMGGGKDKIHAIEKLNICPLSISYEIEPCDILKALETYAKSSGQEYIKRPGEDFSSILRGITQNKGRVHLAVTEPLKIEELEALRGLNSTAFNKAVASLIDYRINTAYRLWPNNYIAKDILESKSQGNYTQEERVIFEEYIEHSTSMYPEEIKTVLLKIYAGPLL